MSSTYTRPTGLALRAALVALVLLLLPFPAHAVPATARIKAAREEADKARGRLDDLSADLEERTEEYFEIEAAVEETRDRIRVTEAELSQATQDLDAAETQLNDRAGSIYRSGPVDFMSVLLGASDFQDFVTRLDLLSRVGRSDAVIVASVKDARARIEAAGRALEARNAEQTALRAKAAEKRATVEEALKEQTRYLAGLDSKLKALITEERKRQERLAAERAAAAARVANAARRAPGRAFDPDNLGDPHPQAVSVARRFVGVTPYLWGGTTPTGFDCSGLVQYCYNEIGIHIPRTSREQFKVGAYIPPDRVDLLEPGDLVFFGRDGDPGRIHHVGMYIGGGNMIHAPQTGQLVSVASLTGRIQSRGDYVGATRP